MIQNLKHNTAEAILEAFKLFEAKLERITEKRILNIRCDGGGEYNGVFLDYIARKGLSK